MNLRHPSSAQLSSAAIFQTAERILKRVPPTHAVQVKQTCIKGGRSSSPSWNIRCSSRSGMVYIFWYSLSSSRWLRKQACTSLFRTDLSNLRGLRNPSRRLYSKIRTFSWDSMSLVKIGFLQNGGRSLMRSLTELPVRRNTTELLRYIEDPMIERLLLKHSIANRLLMTLVFIFFLLSL